MVSSRAAWVLLLAAMALLAPRARASSDFQLWSELGVRYRFAKRWQLKVDAHLRFDENLSATRSLAPECAISYRVWKYMRLEAGYRSVIEPIESRERTYADTWHRFFVDLRFRYRIKPVTLRLRLRGQEQFGWPWKNGEELNVRHTLRQKLGAEWKTGCGLVPLLSGELFVRLADPDGALHKWRLTAGLDYELGAHLLGLFYRLEDVIDDPEEPVRHILGLGYHFHFGGTR
ncbi:MAG: DUF2490 domain-containing protein [Deltaproteobacteria bacterium]|nr:DUF2490 domain-containing protein [Deltaproteobacteria bacterium]